MSHPIPAGTDLRSRGFTPMVIIGYVCACLGGLLGFILAFVVSRRPEPEIRRHAKPMALIAFVALVGWSAIMNSMGG